MVSMEQVEFSLRYTYQVESDSRFKMSNLVLGINRVEAGLMVSTKGGLRWRQV